MLVKKVWKIWTRGAGTPLYLVAAATKERAWELVEEAWKKVGLKGQVGSDYYHQDKYNSISDLEEESTLYGRSVVFSLFLIIFR